MNSKNFLSVPITKLNVILTISTILFVASFPTYLYVKNSNAKSKIKEQYTKSLTLPSGFNLTSEIYAPYTYSCVIAGTCFTYWYFGYDTGYNLQEIANVLKTTLTNQGFSISYPEGPMYNIVPEDSAITKEDHDVLVLESKVPRSAHKDNLTLDFGVDTCKYNAHVSEKINRDMPQCIRITASLGDTIRR
ncbi:hypothetical protein KW803_03470 [Candidatus Saccharibacteria bacterium]|nr:hypothetical protein [Candidatus Saccharibacteria bacterium]